MVCMQYSSITYSSMGSSGVSRISQCPNIIKIGSLFNLQFILLSTTPLPISIDNVITSNLKTIFPHSALHQIKHVHLRAAHIWMCIWCTQLHTPTIEKECKLDYHRWINAINRRNDAVFNLEKDNRKNDFIVHTFALV